MSARIAQDLDGRLPELMARAHVPGLSAVVVEEDQLTWSGASGVKHRDSAERVDNDTVYQAASLSKPAFAVAPYLGEHANAASSLHAPQTDFASFMRITFLTQPRGMRDEMLQPQVRVNENVARGLQVRPGRGLLALGWQPRLQELCAGAPRLAKGCGGDDQWRRWAPVVCLDGAERIGSRSSGSRLAGAALPGLAAA